MVLSNWFSGSLDLWSSETLSLGTLGWFPHQDLIIKPMSSSPFVTVVPFL